MEELEEKDINKHDGHKATCLCCFHLNKKNEEYDEGYDPLFVWNCEKDVWSGTEDELHENLSLAAKCVHFVPRECFTVKNKADGKVYYARVYQGDKYEIFMEKPMITTETMFTTLFEQISVSREWFDV